ncbi:hypothetical protein [Sabulicella rubraurantiaca]|uniref:hypothetical protein n=1 Tax=Sabulicella rubraurantiaca TaxID=2811429 RepID=UPI001A979BAC|nr:hypothetical protein [Sabulicella rubraurantiaca]
MSEDRLRLCARLLANARRDAIALANEDLGDDAWSVGCRAFSFSRHRLQRVAEQKTYPWLRVLDEGMAFTFLIGTGADAVPVRFFRGDAEAPTARTLRRLEQESQQLTLALGDRAETGLMFRMAVETDTKGHVSRVVFLACEGTTDEPRPVCAWPVPLEMPEIERAGRMAQLRLIPDDGYQGPQVSEAASRAKGGRRKAILG